MMKYLDVINSIELLDRVEKVFQDATLNLVRQQPMSFKAGMSTIQLSDNGCVGQNWSSLNFDREDLSGIDFSFSDVRNCSFEGANLDRANFFKALRSSSSVLLSAENYCPGHRSIQTGFADGIQSVPKGKEVLVWGASNRVERWDHNGDLVHRFEPQGGSLLGAKCIGSDKIISWSTDANIRVWNSAGNELLTIEDHKSRIKGVEVLGSPGRIVSWTNLGTVLCTSFEGKTDWSLSFATDEISVKPAWYGHKIAIAHGRGIRLLGFSKKTRAVELNPPHSWIRGIEISDGGRLCLSWDVDGGVCLTDFASGESDRIIGLGDRLPIDGALSLANNFGFVAWSSHGNSISVFKPQEGLVDQLNAHEGGINGAILPPIRNSIISWGEDGTLCRRDLNSRHRRIFRGHTSAVLGAFVLPRNRGLLSWSADGSMRIWGWDGQTLAVLHQHEAPVQAVQMIPGSNTMVSVDEAGVMIFWDVFEFVS